MVRRLDFAVTQGSQAEPLEWLRIELQGDPLALRQKPPSHRPLLIGAIGKAVVALLGCQLAAPEAALLDVALQLLRIGCAPALGGTVRAPETGERTDPGGALVIDDVVRIAAWVEGRPVLLRHAGQAEA